MISIIKIANITRKMSIIMYRLKNNFLLVLKIKISNNKTRTCILYAYKSLIKVFKCNKRCDKYKCRIHCIQQQID